MCVSFALPNSKKREKEDCISALAKCSTARQYFYKIYSVYYNSERLQGCTSMLDYRISCWRMNERNWCRKRRKKSEEWGQRGGKSGKSGSLAAVSSERRQRTKTGRKEGVWKSHSHRSKEFENPRRRLMVKRKRGRDAHIHVYVHICSLPPSASLAISLQLVCIFVLL